MAMFPPTIPYVDSFIRAFYFVICSACRQTSPGRHTGIRWVFVVIGQAPERAERRAVDAAQSWGLEEVLEDVERLKDEHLVVHRYSYRINTLSHLEMYK